MAGAFAALIALTLAAAWLFDATGGESPLQACIHRCAAQHRGGHLVYDGPDTPKSLYKDANSVCRCE